MLHTMQQITVTTNCIAFQFELEILTVSLFHSLYFILCLLQMRQEFSIKIVTTYRLISHITFNVFLF
jgi:hypothetical protein